MGITRRSFLGLILGAGAAQALSFPTLDDYGLALQQVAVEEFPWPNSGTIGAINRATYSFWRNTQVGPSPGFDEVIRRAWKLSAGECFTDGGLEC